MQFLVIEGEVGQRLVDRVVQASSVGVAFWGIALTLLIGMEAKRIVQRLKKVHYYSLVVAYFTHALFASLVLLVASVSIEVVMGLLDPQLVSSIWLGLSLLALISVGRAYVVLAKILARMADE